MAEKHVIAVVEASRLRFCDERWRLGFMMAEEMVAG